MKSAFFYAATAGLATAVLIKGVPAAAEPADIAVAVVRTSDLDLAAETGRRSLDRRVAQAAREVCGEASDFDLEGKNDVRSCVDQTLVRARPARDSLLASGAPGPIIAVTAAR